jgi:signal transduction histidine kinase
VLMQALVIITRCEQQLGNYEKAFGYQRQYIDLRDKAFEEEKTKATLELEAKYETEKKDRELELQRLSLVEKDLEIQKSRVTQLALGGALLFLFVLGLLVRARIKLTYQRKLDEEKLAKQEELLRAVISSVEGERKRFSEDLHDSFGQLISVLKMNVDSLSTAPPSAAVERQRMFDQSVSVLNDMYGELKNVCFNLMPKALIQHGLPVGVNELVARINHTGKLQAESHFFDLDNRLVDIQEISLYRIVQEWTNNILKYSDAKSIFIQITRDEAEITLTIEDDGMGFDEKILTMGQGNGWKNLQSRTNLMKGTIDLDTALGRKGTMLTVNVPAILKGDQSKTDAAKVETLLTYALF